MAVRLKRVAIIGAGIGGLCTAIGLRQRGYDVTVYEQAKAFGEVGAGLMLWANAIKALRKLGIDENRLNGAKVERAEIIDWRGKVFSSTLVDDLHLSAPSLAVHRADLHRTLLEALTADTVCSGIACTGFTQNNEQITAHFADGSTAQADLLIGADGIHSVVRKNLFPQVKLRYAGYVGWRGVADNFTIGGFDRTSEAWGRGARFGVVPIGTKRIYWFATANLPAGQKLNPVESKIYLREHFRGWHAPVEALIEATPEEKILYNDITDFAPIEHWSQGQAVLLGDSAHATTPNLGQGACQAMESSVMLARCLTEENTLPDALARYERERKPRTAWITNTSWQLGRVAQIENPLLCAMRDFALRCAPAAATHSQIKKSAGYEV